MSNTDNIFTMELNVRFRDLDAMKHVNNSVYLTYLEEARAAYWRQMVGARGLHEINFILAKITCKYKSPAKYGEVLKINTWLSRLGNKSFDFSYNIVEKETGRLVAEAYSVQVFYDYKENNTIQIPENLKKKFEKLVKKDWC